MMCGGLAEQRTADESVQALVDKVKGELQGKTNKEFPTFKATHYCTQVVAGTNYFVKVDVGGEFIHLRIFVPLPCDGTEPELSAFQLGKTEADPITHFD